MYAVIKTGGKQYKVCAGEKIRVEQLSADIGQDTQGLRFSWGWVSWLPWWYSCWFWRKRHWRSQSQLFWPKRPSYQQRFLLLGISW